MEVYTANTFLPIFKQQTLVQFMSDQMSQQFYIPLL